MIRAVAGRSGRAARVLARGGLLLGALAAVASPARAQPAAPPLFETFKRVCGDTHADYARATADPEVRSWKRIPIPVPVPIKGVKLSQKSIRVKSFEKGVVRMYMGGTGEAVFGGRPAKFESCSVSGRPTDLQTTVRQVQAWLGQPPTSVARGTTTFRFHQAGGKRTPLGPGKLSDAVKGFESGEVVSIDVGPQERSTAIYYISIKL